MKQIYKTLILTLCSLWSVASLAQNQVAYGFIQDPNNPLIITAVAYPNFTSNNVTIATGLFSFLLPAGTITDPAIPPAPGSGSFVDLTGDWTAQLVNAANYSSVPGNDPNDLMGFDVYQVVLQNSPSPNIVSGQPVQLFRFTLTNDCMGDSVRVLVNNSAIQMAILNNLGANFNNEMSISVNNAPSVDLYVGNAPAGDILPCPLDDVPDAVNDTISVNEDSGPTNILVVANDVFGNNGPAIAPVNIVTTSVNGTTTLNQNGTPNNPTDDFLTYTPNANFFGQDSIFYAICDANGDCDTAKVVITVNAVNDTPVAVNDSYPINEDAPLLGDVTDNDSDVDGPMVLITLVTNVANGTLTLNGDGTFSYTPNANFNGSDSFVYSYCDGGTPNLCDTATVTIPVGALNDPPIAVDDSYPINEDTPLAGDVTDNDSDADGPMVLITLVTNAANGTLTLNGDGTFSYTPNANFNGSDSFVYSYCDGGTPNQCDTATVTIPVGAVNDAPVAVNDSYPINEDTPLAGDVTDNDSDVDGPMVLITLVTNAANGTLTLNGDGTFSYTPNANFTGSDSFVYSYCDGGTPNLCDTATVTIPVGAVNDAPVANNDSYPINEDTPVSGDVTDNDTDADGPMVLITLVTNVANGTLTLNGDGTFSYTPNANFTGSDSFVYSYCDGGTPNQCDTATVAINVAAIYVRLSPRMLLQGPLLDGSTPFMADNLRSENKLPLTEPYSSQPAFTHVNGGGGESATSGVIFTDNGGNSIVDWVFIELRSALDPAVVVATRSGLLQRDGDVVDVDGISPLLFANTLAGSYYVAVRHRNHLGTMTADPIALSTTGTVVDFTQTSIPLWDDGTGFNGFEQATIGARFALWAGNTNQNQATVYSGQSNDKSPIFNKIDTAPGNPLRLQSYVFNGYHSEDVNLSGEAIYSGQNNDPNYIFNIIDSHPRNLLRLQSFVAKEQLANDD